MALTRGGSTDKGGQHRQGGAAPTRGGGTDKGGGTDEGGSTNEGGQGDEGRVGRQHVKQQVGRARVDVATSHTLNTNEVGREGLSLKPVEC